MTTQVMTPVDDTKEISETSLSSASEDQLHTGPETFEAPVVGDGIPIISMVGIDPIFEEKSKAINEAIQHMGWGRYQTKLFLLSGFGWFVDNMCVHIWIRYRLNNKLITLIH
ncbi:hypothetical protein TWF694_009340 [Orbilia ellipsospora]|uniref:Uncharacterized protein n=1 Tax=Orbilia ellipsospora TaxID=2528407 RepID=A0AAV9XEM0_9PEZI